MENDVNLDTKDREIIRLLQEDAWMTHAGIGEIVHLSSSAVQRRIEKLRKHKVITGATINVDPKASGRGLRFYLLLELQSDSADALAQLGRDIAAWQDVTQVDLLAGKFDILITVDCADAESFTDGAMKTLNNNPNVRHTWTLTRMKELSKNPVA